MIKWAGEKAIVDFADIPLPKYRTFITPDIEWIYVYNYDEDVPVRVYKNEPII